MLSWSNRQRIREYFEGSLWPIPALCVLAAVALAMVLPAFDRATTTEPPFSFGASAATELLSAIATGMIAFTGFVFAILLVVVQFGSSAFSPRAIRSLTHSLTSKYSLGVFVATFVYALLILSEIDPIGGEGFVPQISVNMAVLLVVASVFVFLHLVSDIATELRATELLSRVATKARGELAKRFPDSAPAQAPDPVELPSGHESHTVFHTGTSGVLQAVDQAGLVAEAQRIDGWLSLVPPIGAFVWSGDELIEAIDAGTELNEAALTDAVLFGTERSIRQDPAYALRILADVAVKALSPAINDPTTATQALNEIGDLLHELGTRRLPDGLVYDAEGQLRLVYSATSWEDYLDEALTEIIAFGAGSPMVVARLREQLSALEAVVPDYRKDAITHHRNALDSSILD